MRHDHRPQASERGVRLVLHRLVDHGLMSAQEAGAATLYALNREHVAASVVEGLLRLRTELIERVSAVRCMSGPWLAHARKFLDAAELIATDIDADEANASVAASLAVLAGICGGRRGLLRQACTPLLIVDLASGTFQ